MGVEMFKHSTKFSSTLFLLALTAFLNACSNKVEQADAGKIATFYVDSVEGSSEISKVDAVYAIPKERLYNFKACIKDIMQSKAIQAQSFKILGGEEDQVIETDEQGCLNWNESVEYNFLAQSNYIKISRTIVANGLHKGATDVQFAINPWSHGEDASRVVDPKKKSVVALSQEAEGSSAFLAGNVRSPLWAIAPRVSIVEQEYSAAGAKMVLKFQTKLSLVLKNSAQQNVQYPISNGSFDVEMVLYNAVVENGKEALYPIAHAVENSVTFTQDTLIAEFPFTLNTLPNKGQIFLGVKVSASSNDIGLDPFEGVYMVSNTPSVKIEAFPVPVKGQTYSAVKAAVVGDQAEKKADKKEEVKPGLEIEKLDIRFFKIGSETTTDRQVFYNVKACIKSNLDKRPIRDEVFSVQTSAGKNVVSLKSSQEGCISWDDSIWHKVFGNERFIKRTVVIAHSGFNLNKKIEVIINPWDSGSNFGRDERFVEDFNSVNINPSSENARIHIDNYNFAVVNYKYEINKNLDLTLIKNGILSLSAKVVNHSSLSYGRNAHEFLRDGKYMLKWAVVTLDENDKADSVISTGEKVVTTFGGDLKTDVSFKVSAFEKLNIRSRLVVALYTIKEPKTKNAKIEIDRNSGLEATPYIGTIILNRDEEGQKMMKVEDNLGLGKGDIFTRLSILGTGNSNASLAMEKVLASHNMKKVNLASEKDSLFLRDGLANPLKYHTLAKNPAYYHAAEQKPAVSATILASFAKTGKLNPELAVQFCSFWFNDYFRRQSVTNKTVVLDDMTTQRLVTTCVTNVRRDPSRFFKTDKKLVVKKIGNVKYAGGTTTNFSVGNSFSVAKADATSKTQTWSWTNSVGLSFELFDIFKLNSTGSYAIASAHSKTDTTSSTAVVNASTYMFMQTSTFNVELSSYEECSSIRLSPELFSSRSLLGSVFSNSMKAQEVARVATSGLFLCTGVDNTAPVVKKESYYLVSQDMGSKGGEQDSYSRENQQLFMTFRGQKDLSSFLSIIQASVKGPSSSSALENTTSTNVTGTAKSMGSLPTWPGVYSDGE